MSGLRTFRIVGKKALENAQRPDGVTIASAGLYKVRAPFPPHTLSPPLRSDAASPSLSLSSRSAA